MLLRGENYICQEKQKLKTVAMDYFGSVCGKPEELD